MTGLHNATLKVLTLVPDADARSWVTNAELTAKVDRSRVSVSNSTKQLHRRGLVERRKRTTRASGKAPYEFRRTAEGDTVVADADL